MSLPVPRRKKPRTPVGKVVRAWPWLRRGLRVVRLLKRLRHAIAVGFAGLAAVFVGRLVRRLRGGGRAAAEPLTRPASEPIAPVAGAGQGASEGGMGSPAAPAPAEPTPSGPQTPAGAGTEPTETERRKAGEKLDVDAPNEGAPGHGAA